MKKSKLFLVTGFIGSGKTNFIKHIAKDGFLIILDEIDKFFLKDNDKIITYNMENNDFLEKISNSQCKNIILEKTFLDQKFLDELSVFFEIKIIFLLDFLNYDFIISNFKKYFDSNLEIASLIINTKVDYVSKSKQFFIKNLHLNSKNNVDFLKKEGVFFEKMEDYRGKLNYKKLNLANFYQKKIEKIQFYDGFYRVKGIKDGYLLNFTNRFHEYEKTNKKDTDLFYFNSKY